MPKNTPQGYRNEAGKVVGPRRGRPKAVKRKSVKHKASGKR